MGETVCLVTYRNIPELPATRLDFFPTVENAVQYVKDVEPTVPRVSLNDEVPHPTPSWPARRLLGSKV